MGLVIEPYTETTTKIRPQRAKGRRKAHYDVAVENKANAPVLVALEGEDPDDELDFGFNRPPHEIPPGKTVETGMQVRPPKQIWIGRATERRFTVDHADRREGRGAARRRADVAPRSSRTRRRAAPKKKGLFRPPPAGRRRPRRLRPARLQAAGLRAGHEHRPGRHLLPQAPAHAARRSRARR